MASGEKDTAAMSIKRQKKVYLAMGLSFVILFCTLFYKSACVEGVNPTADMYRRAAIATADSRTVTPGNVYDRNQKLIVEQRYEEEPVLDEEGNPEKNDKGEPLTKSVLHTIYRNAESYTQVIGYSSSRSVSIKDNDVAVHQRNYRLMKLYSDLLYTPSEVEADRGNSIVTTLDADLQDFVYGILRAETGGLGKGGCIVADARTGEILAMVSLPTYDLTDMDAAILQMAQEPAEREAYYPVTHKAAKAEGSIFKIITLVALLDSGMQDFVCNDSEFKADGKVVSDAYPEPGDEIGYLEAFERSSNCYFAQAGLALGSSKLEETAKKFLVGEDILLDFGSIASYWNLDRSNRAELAETAYGQGKVNFSLMTALMMTQAIANDGVMLEPHLLRKILDSDGEAIDEIVGANGKIIAPDRVEVLSEVTGSETANKVTEAMLASTQGHFAGLTPKEREIYEKYNIASKTGTAENGQQINPNNAWFVSFAPAENPQYVIVMNHCETDKFGSQLMGASARIYEYLFNDGEE